MIQQQPDKIALIGFGEAGQAFCKGWSGELSSMFSAYDIKSLNPDTVDLQQAIYTNSGIAGFKDIGACTAEASAIFSLVTADQALFAAESTAKFIPENGYYFDCNSCAPDTKKAASVIIANAGGRYVDVAVMAPVYPLMHKVPLLISGPDADDALVFLSKLGMSPEFAGEEIGRASSIKMIRSIMVKGLEALVAECVLSGRKAGVENVVLETLEKSYPGFGWHKRASYMLERMMVHGPRRAAEMREVSLTVEQLGLDSSMSKATTKWQQKIGDLELAAGEDSLPDRADAILAALKK